MCQLSTILLFTFFKLTLLFLSKDQLNDPIIKKAIANNAGTELPRDSNAFFVLFLKKLPFDKFFDELREILNPLSPPPDFTRNSSFFCSGTILSPRWVLTTASPISYYPVSSYLVVAERHIDTTDSSLLDTHSADDVLLHPDHESGEADTNLALVHLDTPLSFRAGLTSANLGFGSSVQEYVIQGCVVLGWGWKERPGNTTSLIATEHIFTYKDDGCTSEREMNNYFCFEETNYQACALNTGAPVVCESVVVGILGEVSCNETAEKEKYKALRLDNDVEPWLKTMLNGEINGKHLRNAQKNQQIGIVDQYSCLNN